MAQVAHEILGIEFERIKVLQGDTLYCPFSTATWGSRSIVMAGGAVAEASRLLGERAKRIGAWLLQAEPSNTHLANGRVHARRRHAAAEREFNRITSRRSALAEAQARVTATLVETREARATAAGGACLSVLLPLVSITSPS